LGGWGVSAVSSSMSSGSVRSGSGEATGWGGFWVESGMFPWLP
jgi:hypothetical protein